MKTIISIRGLAAMVACACVFVFSATAPALATVKPIGGTDIGLERDPGNSIVARATTDGNGQVLFPNLKPGRYTLVIDGSAFRPSPDGDKADCVQVSVSVGDAAPGYSVQAPMCPSAAKQGMRVTFDLPNGGSASTRIVRLTNIRTNAVDAGNGGFLRSRHGSSAAIGDVDIIRMKTAPNTGNGTTQDAPINTSRSNIKHGLVEAGGDSPNGQARTWVSGVGDDANPCSRTAPCKPVADITVSAVDGSGRAVGRMTTDAKGEAVFRALPPGHYTLIVQPKDLQRGIFHPTNTTGEYDRKVGGPVDSHSPAAGRVYVSLTIGAQKIGTQVISGDAEGGVAIAFDVPGRGTSTVRFEIVVIRDNSETQTAD